MFKKTKIAALTAAVLGLSSLAIAPSVQAVSVNEAGATGQVLVFPYYNVNNGFVTGFNITNTKSNSYKAVKVRFRESKTSNDVLDFNVYMSPNDIFTMSLTKSSSGGVLLSTSDKTCTHPAIPASGVEFIDVYDSVDSEDIREGYLEVIEMGEITDADVKAGILHANGIPNDCSAIETAWKDGSFTQGGAASNAGIGVKHSKASGYPNSASEAGFYGAASVKGLSAPTGGLAGSAILLDTRNVAGFVVEPTAITNYSTRAQHYLSSDQNFYLLPSLASGNDAVSNVTADDFRSTHSATWTTVARDFGLDDKNLAPNGSVPSGINPMPIAHAMAITSLSNQFFLKGATSTDFVVATPMRKHGIFNDYSFVADATGYDKTKDIAVAGNEANGYWDFLDQADVNSEFVYFDREEGENQAEAGSFSPPLRTQTPNVPFDTEVKILALNASGSNNTSVLGSDNAQGIEIKGGFENGWGKFDFSSYDLSAARYTSAWVSVSASAGAMAKGVPMSGFIAARGTVNGQNVGETFPHVTGRTRGNTP